MSKNIYREKTLDNMNSPDNISDYIRVINPRLILLLSAVAVLLFGAIIWGIFGHIRSVVNIEANSDGQILEAYVTMEDAIKIKEDMTVVITENGSLINGSVDNITAANDRVKITIIPEKELPNGKYNAEIVIKDIKPISFILN